MSQRQIQFDNYRNHGWLKKSYNRLSVTDLNIARQFIQDNDNLDKQAFFLKVNRMFIDKEKPKNFTTILELLTCCNS